MNKSVINGAGLVGCLLSLLLKKLGHEVDVYEKRSDFSLLNQQAGRSINLILTAKGVKALKDLELFSEIKTLCVPVYGRSIHGLDGDQTFQAYGKDKSEYNLSVSRFELNQKLLQIATKAGIHFFFDHDLEDIDLKEKVVKFSPKINISYENIFATDGAGSLIRQKLCHEMLGENETHWLPSSYKELLMPANSKLDHNSLHIWPRGNQFLMGLPNRDGSFTMTLYLESSKFNDLKSDQQILDHFKKYYPNTLELIPNLSGQFQKNPVGKLGTVLCRPWSNAENLLLLGDAAHAIVPFFGQGMNLGFNDCSHLFVLLQKESHLGKAFKEFEINQKKNADAIAEMALENFTEMQSTVADPNFLKLKKIESEIEQAFPELYRSRYALITYTLVPYSHCQAIGLIQKEILKVVANLETGLWDKNLTLELIKSKLLPYYEKNGINILTFKF